MHFYFFYTFNLSDIYFQTYIRESLKTMFLNFASFYYNLDFILFCDNNLLYTKNIVFSYRFPPSGTGALRANI